MAQMNGAEEPTMDDILASIRKIIAEETGISTTAAQQPEPAASAPAQSQASRSPASEHPASLASRLNDVFGTGGDDRPLPASASTRTGAAARSAVEDDLSDLLADRPERQVSIGLPPLATTPRAAQAADAVKRAPLDFGGFGAPAPAVQSAGSPPATPANGAATQAPIAPVATRLAPVAAAPASVIPIAAAERPAPAAGVTSTKAAGVEFSRTPVVPAAPAFVPAAARIEVGDEAAKPAVPEIKTSASESGPVVLAAMPARMPQLAVLAPAPKLSPATVGPAAASAVPAAAPTAGSAQTPRQVSEPAAVPVPPPTAALAIGLDTASHAMSRPSGAGSATEPDHAADAVASALGALAAGLAAAARPPTPEIVVPTVDVVAPAQVGVVSASPAPSVPDGARAIDTSSAVSVFTSPDAFVGGVALQPVTSHALEDRAAELLRPMLRQWLDSNMPRIVEKALRSELAGHPLDLSKPPKD